MIAHERAHLRHGHGAFLTLYPSADSEILVFSLAVVIIGGRGSLAGAAVGALLVGMLNAVGQVIFPELAYFAIFGPMAVLLAFRPLGFAVTERVAALLDGRTQRSRLAWALVAVAAIAAASLAWALHDTERFFEAARLWRHM